MPEGINGASNVAFRMGLGASWDGGFDCSAGRRSQRRLRRLRIESTTTCKRSSADKYYAAGKKAVVDDDQAAEAARGLSENEDETEI